MPLEVRVARLDWFCCLLLASAPAPVWLSSPPRDFVNYPRILLIHAFLLNQLESVSVACNQDFRSASGMDLYFGIDKEMKSM